MGQVMSTIDEDLANLEKQLREFMRKLYAGYDYGGSLAALTRIRAALADSVREAAAWAVLEKVARERQTLFSIELEHGYEWNCCNGGEPRRRRIKATRLQALEDAANWATEAERLRQSGKGE